MFPAIFRVVYFFFVQQDLLRHSASPAEHRRFDFSASYNLITDKTFSISDNCIKILFFLSEIKKQVEMIGHDYIT